MNSELNLVALRLRDHEEGHLRDKGPWIAQKAGDTYNQGLTVRNVDGKEVIISKPQGSNLPFEPRKIFGYLIEDIRDFVRIRKVTVHLHNEWGQTLLSISPECNIGLYESQITIRNAHDGKDVSLGGMPHENDRPLCPKCHEKSGLEPAHWEPNNKSSEWRWVCVDCDYAVSCDTDNKFSPTGKLASREMRRTRATLRELFSMLWNSGLMKKVDAYKLLNQFFPNKEGERVNFATLNVLEMQEAADYAKNLMNERGRQDRTEWAQDEMKQLYKAITHEEGEPTYLGDGMYLFPNGRVGEV